MISVQSYAKINLYLDVLNRRRDGFHNIETVFQSISLYDSLTFERTTKAIALSCSRSELDTGPDNLVIKAANRLREATGCTCGATIHLDKNIPVAAGLAGGSGNAAATLVALNLLWELGLSPIRLQQVALDLGSDVPYCLSGGTRAARSRGEVMEHMKGIPPVHFVLVHPAVQVSTKEVYLHPDLRRNASTPFAGWTSAFRRSRSALESGDFSTGVFNGMEGVVFQMHPDLAQIKQVLLDAGCTTAAMSGSGPTIFGVCNSNAAANRIAERLQETGRNASVVTPVDQGLVLRSGSTSDFN